MRDETNGNVVTPIVASKLKRASTGHELPLSSMIKNGYPAVLRLMSGENVYGVVTSFDKWTITIMPKEAKWPETFFKHAIESFTRIEDGNDE